MEIKEENFRSIGRIGASWNGTRYLWLESSVFYQSSLPEAVLKFLIESFMFALSLA